jgi:hypothetical protein
VSSVVHSNTNWSLENGLTGLKIVTECSELRYTVKNCIALLCSCLSPLHLLIARAVQLSESTTSVNCTRCAAV